MQKYEIVEQYIEEKNVRALQSVIGGIYHIERNYEYGEFDELVEYVSRKGIKLKDDELRGKLVSEGKSTFTKEDYSDAIYELTENFCDERIEDVKKIGRAVYGNKPSQTKATKPTATSKSNGTLPKVESHQSSQNVVMIAAALVAAIVVGILVYLITR